MGRLTVRLPDALHHQLENMARKEGVSLNQYLVYALTRQAVLDSIELDQAGGTRQRSQKSTAANPSDTVDNLDDLSEETPAVDFPDYQ